MSRLATNWLIIVIVLVICAANPLYRHYMMKPPQPIVTLGLDLKGGVEVLLRAEPEKAKDSVSGETPKLTPDQVEGAKEVIRNRVDPQGTKELYLSVVGTDRILLQVPGEKNPDGVIQVLGDTAQLEFVNTGQDNFHDGDDFYTEGTQERKPEYEKYETILTGADLARADFQHDDAGRPAVGFTFKPDGAKKFGEFTRDHVGQYMTILLDGKVLTSPSIDEPIWGGKGIIRGQFTGEQVDKVVRQLNAGALPVPLSILSASVVGPSLGEKSIQSSFIAGVVGFGLVLLFMLVFYRLPGMIANVALAMYIVLVLGMLSLINATLTLPGIAGFLLSIGMAIDANIIIFERLKEEIRWGKTLIAAMDAAFARAWVAILDGHVTLLLGAAVLYFFGTGPVKGFAVTLFVGALLALYSGVFVTRTILDTMVRRVKNVHLYVPGAMTLENPALRLQAGHYIRFVERTGLWVTISVLVLLTGLGFGVKNHLGTGKSFNEGIDFTGGEQIILRVKEALPSDSSSIQTLVQKYSAGEATVQVDEADTHIVSIRMRLKAEGQSEDDISRSRTENFLALKKEIGNAFGGYVAEGAGANPEVQQYNFVGPTVGRELIANAIWALCLGCLLIFIYILFRFPGWAYSAAAILALLHDVLLTLAIAIILRLEINSSFIAVILTIVGYSMNDTIIIFDRVRENLRHFGPSANFAQLCNLSLTQTLTRSINTVLTVLFMTGALMIFGGESIHSFMVAMLAGLISGAYSSIYIAVPIMMWLTRGKKPATATLVAATPGGPSMQVALGGSPIESETPSVASQMEQARERRERKGGKQQRRR